MSDSGFETALGLSMSVVGYEFEYNRSLGSPTGAPSNVEVASHSSLTMVVTGATVDDHDHPKPIKQVLVNFSDGPFDSQRVGFLLRDTLNPSRGFMIVATLPWADLVGIWTALQLDRVATVQCTIKSGTDIVSGLKVRSQTFPPVI